MKKTNIVKIKDLSGDKFFMVRAMNVLEGIELMDKIAGSVQDWSSGKHISIKDYLNDLIPLAMPMDANGVKVVWDGKFTLNDACGMFENPVALMELAKEVLTIQQGFFEQYPLFQQLMNQAKGLFNTQSSELTTV